MHRLLQLLSVLAVLVCLPATSHAQETVRLGYLFSDGNIPGTLSAYQALMAERPDLQGRVELSLLAESTFADTRADQMRSSRVLVFDTMNEQMLTRWNAENNADLLAEVAQGGTVLGVGEGLLPQETYADLDVVFDQRARAYWQHSGPQNQLALMKLALARAGITGLELPEPQLSLDFGYYYPDGNSGTVFATWEEFDAWRAANGKTRPGAPRVAIGFFKATYYSGDTALLNALVAEIERQGGGPIPVFGYPGAVAFERLLLDGQGAPRADVGLGANFQFVDAQSPEILENVGIPVINLISLYGRSEAEWRASDTGLSAFEGTFNVAAPEFAGTVAPTVVGTKEKVRDPSTGLTSVITSPIPSRVAMSVSRALRYAELRRKANAEKKIALMYYNYPPGKANISASYLNVAESIANILERLQTEGYDIGGAAPDVDEVLAAITSKARNIMSEAPGELDELIAQGGVERVPVTQYRQWLENIAPPLRAKILADWGEPEDSRIMTIRDGAEPSFAIPGVHYGNILLTPQPSRAWGDDIEKMYHATDLAPHHQYVAVYAWLRNGFGADAVVHIGTHGTLEWLDGRAAGLAEDDAPDALIGDLPDAYIYNVDVVGEGLVARRRGMATLIDHMVPPFKQGELTEDLARLSEVMNDHSRNETTNPELAAIYGRQVQEQAVALGIAKDLDLDSDPDTTWSDEDLHRIEGYLLELREQLIPYGLHAFGRTPEREAVESTVQAIVSVDRTMLPDQRQVLADEMDRRITVSGTRELDGLVKALGGQFVPAGSGGEPIRNPDAYATGNNFYGIDPDKVPKPAAWEMGTALAEQMLQDHLSETGAYPEKVSFVIWGDETMRHEGVLESQIFYLLGTKPVWDARGKVVGVELVPRAELGRPRIDIVIASAAEGMFNNVTRLMDEAVQLAKSQDEDDNNVRRHYLATRSALIAKGIDPEDADKMAGVRIFDEAPGKFNLNTSTIVASSGSWDSDSGFANDYIRKMGHAYGNGYWGEAMPDVFSLALADVDTVVHSNSTALYGALDNDDMFMYVGGLATAIRSVGGDEPELLVTDTRDPGKPAMTGVDHFLGREFRSRYVNPTWIEGMQKEGYAGATEMRAFVEYLWGWDATVSNTVDDTMWNETFETYVEDKYNLGMKDYFESSSPFAYQDIAARMIETVRKGYWQAEEETLATLLNEYIASINAHGVNCTDVSCGNGRLLEYVMHEAENAGVPAPAISAARNALEQAMGQKIEVAAMNLRDYAQRNDALEDATRAENRRNVVEASFVAQAGTVPSPESTTTQEPQASSGLEQVASQTVQGIIMEEEIQTTSQSAATPNLRSGPLSPLEIAWPIGLLLTLLAGFRWREHARARAA